MSDRRSLPPRATGLSATVLGAAPPRRRALRMRGVLASAALLTAWAGPAMADEVPEPVSLTSPVAAGDVPEDVIEWFLEAGSQAVTNQAIQLLGLSPEAAAAAELGVIRSVMTWSPEYIEATSLVDPVIPAERWIAPILSPISADPDDDDDADDDDELDGAGPEENGDGDSGPGADDPDQVGERTSAEAGADDDESPTDDADPEPGVEDEMDSYEFLGVLHAARADNNGGVRWQGFIPGAVPARDIAGLDLDAMVVFDEALEAWFAIIDGEVQPVDLAARETLAGSISLPDYQSFVVERHAVDGDAASESGEVGSAVPAIWTAGIIGSLLFLTAAIVWLRKGD